ncbi:pyruvate, phosphate dikinase [Candidatus Deianiraea vastatrix]|uniref:Pyruvate, phosphate dikinase n=1 Tax=Candidatus Deianiraea vastatrix TaxID=2163644 RepID=A0A5B8XFJ6_9RICK|nr:pyruvate, phosphate dikinase [Candidatus Deianiraea vastatrix]QED23071.1 Pyruvate, phosphate dikinase [Candidatus Deianiraea vastatrix]
MTEKKSIYFFGNKSAEGNGKMRDILGGKGANLAEMANIGIAVPCGFTISTQECNKYYENGNKISKELETEIDKYVKKLEDEIGASFGSEEKPLLVSVRSGAKFSMPGMMDTILNLGLNDKTVIALEKRTNNRRFALDSYRRFIQMYSDVVLGIDHHNFESILEDTKLAKGIINDTDLTADDLEKIVAKFKQIVLRETKSEFVQDIKSQLMGAIEAVFKSWMNERAIIYRKLHSIPDACGTAVNIQSMVFGNMGNTSATGVAFTRNPSTGEKKFYGEFLINAQGEDVVAGIRTPQPLLAEDGKNSMQELMPETYAELAQIFTKLENHYKDMQDVEFTVQEGKLWVLQTRSGKRSVRASVVIAVNMVSEGVITKEEAILRVEPNGLNQLLHPVLDRASDLHVIARGLPASPGAVSGKVVFDSKTAEEMRGNGHEVLLVRNETSPDDIGGMHSSVGILTAKGGMTSHAAVVARGMGKPCVSGCDALLISQHEKTIQIKGTKTIIKEGDLMTIDGGTGEIILGKARTTSAASFAEFDTLMKWSDEVRKIKVRVNAETALDVKTALGFGAEGIGLCRTEHMFFEKQKLLHFRKMILSEDKESRILALKEIKALQIADFAEIIDAMSGLPVNIRLLDPPLHEFVPHTKDEIDEIANYFKMDAKFIEAKAKTLHEANPMLGHRGSRLGVTYPEIFQMQVSAIFTAAISVFKKTAVMPQIEIMLPVIIDKKELKLLVDIVKSSADETLRDAGLEMKYKVGTMIEIPRACIIADEIAEIADYCSFGTNDLTQTTLGISRDDSGQFLPEYQKQGIFEHDPFATIDVKGVGTMIDMAISKARSVKKDITLSICGEHGGDPKSIAFFASLGVNYVSCSPFRIPIARLACSQAAVLVSKN